MNSYENLDTKELQILDSAHFFHPFSDHKSLSEKGSRIITRAEGIYIWDSEGKKSLDSMSGIWCVNIGYGRKELADAAHKQMINLSFYNSFFQSSNIPAIKLAARLSSLAPKFENQSFSHVFFTSGGSESNDTVVRMVRRYWDLLGQHKRKIIISRHNSYHGSTLTGVSLSGMDAMQQQGGMPQRIGIEHIQQPYWYELSNPNETTEEFGFRSAQWLEEKILSIGADRVAAFIAEPVQGTGGVIVPPATYWPEIQRIVDKYGILLISDEVTCAFGRLGHWFAYEKFGYRPDLIAFAKGVTSGYIPLGGVMISNKIADILIEKGGSFLHGYTYSGHPVSCAVALANIDILENEKLLERVKNDTGPYLAEKFNDLKKHPLVGDVDTCGLMAGLVLVKNKDTRETFPKEYDIGSICQTYCMENGIIMRPWGNRMIIAPPLIITRSDIDKIIDSINKSLDSTLKDLKSLYKF